MPKKLKTKLEFRTRTVKINNPPFGKEGMEGFKIIFSENKISNPLFGTFGGRFAQVRMHWEHYLAKPLQIFPFQ